MRANSRRSRRSARRMELIREIVDMPLAAERQCVAGRVRLLDSRHRAMKEIAHYQLEYAIEVQVSRTFAWNWRIDVRNWDDPPAHFRLEAIR
jgi:hypothetical protein